MFRAKLLELTARASTNLHAVALAYALRARNFVDT